MKITTITLQPNQATLTCYVQDLSAKMPNTDIRPAALIFPGGGYQYCSDREAEPIALAYMAEGYNAFVLRYTVGPDCPLEKALQDAQAALQYLRDHAQEFRIDPQKIVAIGFSAGGHLAAAMGTQSPMPLRPNALVLGYAVTLGSMWAPMGKQSPDLGTLVDAQTPPTFLFTNQGDSVVPVKNSLLFADALADEGIPFALHVFPTGDHGMSLAKPCTSSGELSQLNPTFAEWLPMSVSFLQDIWGSLGVVEPDPSLVNQMRSWPLSLDAPLKKLIRNPKAKEILKKSLGEKLWKQLEANPMYYGISLRKVAGFAPDSQEEWLARIDAELAKIEE